MIKNAIASKNTPGDRLNSSKIAICEFIESGLQGGGHQDDIGKMRRNQSDLRSGREVEFVLRCPGIAINYLCGNCLAVVWIISIDMESVKILRVV